MLANGKRTADWHPVQAKDDKGDYFLVRAFDSTSTPGWSRCAGTLTHPLISRWQVSG